MAGNSLSSEDSMLDFVPQVYISSIESDEPYDSPCHKCAKNTAVLVHLPIKIMSTTDIVWWRKNDSHCSTPSNLAITQESESTGLNSFQRVHEAWRVSETLLCIIQVLYQVPSSFSFNTCIESTSR